MTRRRPLLVFAVALAVRLIYLAQVRHAPYFDVPLVDGANYFRMAAAIASGDLLGGPQAFWQPPLYPYFLAVLMAITGPRMIIVCAVQAVIGSLSCLLVFFTGRRLFGPRAALWAAAVMAFYGPLIHFDAQPLTPVLHTGLAIGGLLLLLRAARIPEAGGREPGAPAGLPRARVDLAWGAAGLAWGLAAITTPNILLVVPPAAFWAFGRGRSAERQGGASPAGRGEAGPRIALAERSGWSAALLFIAGVALPVALVAARNLAVAGEPILISSNGGINFFIGNNPDYERTIRIRPGGEFERLAQEPENLGITGAAARSRYFTRRALQFLAGYPGEALRLYLRKGIDLVAGREIPRNQDAYGYRSYSSLLALLLWRFGISFPFGLVAPLALAGALLPRRPSAEAAAGDAIDLDESSSESLGAGRRLLWLYAGMYAVSILIFFPTDRYRLPLVPVAALFAGRLIAASAAAWRCRRVVLALLAGLAIFNLDALKAGESYPEEEALNRAYALRARGRLDEARDEYRHAIALDPRRIDAYNSLAALAAQQGRWDEAAGHYRDLLEIAPDFVEVRRNLGQAYTALGRREEARQEWEIAANLAPGAGLALTDLCMSYYEEGALAVAEPYCRRAVGARPDLPDPHLALARVARALRNDPLARAEAAEAARLFPPGSPGWQRARKIQTRLGDGAAAE
ncbi:MAG TPA: tetratricopeptide repeat protein [Candidatus Polarisedimenticolia bacterium]|nr:tetratricopeptide repeat protein [Candidatus Polarisedimenticolia bacterium]